MLVKKTRKKMFCRIFSLSFLLLSFLSLPVPIYAISGDDLIAYPTNSDPNNPLTESWFIYNLNAGESKQDSLTLKNESNQKQTIKIYAVDSTTNNVGEFALESESDTKDGIGKWIKMETDSVTLEPKEQKQINFTIDIPQDARSGEISGGIIIQKELTQEQKNTESGFIITTRLGIRIYETVPGDVIQKVTLRETSLQYNKEEKNYILNVVLKNESTISVEPKVKAEIKDIFFNKQNQTVEQKVLIPRESEVTVSLPIQKPKIGKFEVTPQFSYQKQNGEEEVTVDSRKLYFWTLPWTEVTVLALLIFVNIIFLLILKIKSRREKKYYKNYKVQLGDNLETIAEKLEIDWKKIAKINKMEPPYQISEGNTIIVIDKNNVLEQPIPQLNIKHNNFGNVEPESRQEFEKDMLKIEEKSFIQKIQEKTGKKFYFFIILVLIAIGGYFLYSNISSEKNANNYNNNINNTVPAAKNQTSEKEEETTTENTTANQEKNQLDNEAEGPKEVIQADRETVKIQILNGSGVKGASSKASALLKEEGYSNISIGNADRFDYENTTIECGSGIKAEICKEVEEIVSQTYSNIKKDTNKDLDNMEIKVILGK